MKFRETPRAKIGFDLTPLVDVVFLLLIFFLLSSSFIMQPGIKIKLPSAKTHEVQPANDIFILIDKQERIYLRTPSLSEERVKISELSTHLKSLIKEDGERVIIIKADEAVRHGIVVRVLDMVKLIGAQRIAIATEPKRKEENAL
jgi:biopolymer transport protein ExbD